MTCHIFLNIHKKRLLVSPLKNTKFKTIKEISSYCLESVKKYDYENFLATLLLPSDARESAFALRAFNIELAQVKDMTSEELPARMRFQFWREALDKIYQHKPPNHPVAKAVHEATERHKLSKIWLRSLIDSREDNLIDKPYANLQALEDYSEKSNSSLYFLILQIMGLKDLQADHAASHIGKSEGIAKLIRGIPICGSKRVVLIPTTLLVKHEVSQQDFIRGKKGQNVRDVVYDLASAAYQHLNHARELEENVPKSARTVFLPAVSISSFLRQLQLHDFDIFDPKLQKRNAFLPLKLWWGKMRNTYR